MLLIFVLLLFAAHSCLSSTTLNFGVCQQCLTAGQSAMNDRSGNNPNIGAAWCVPDASCCSYFVNSSRTNPVSMEWGIWMGGGVGGGDTISCRHHKSDRPRRTRKTYRNSTAAAVCDIFEQLVTSCISCG